MLKNGNYLKHWKPPVIIKQVLIFWYEIDGQDLNDIRNNENFSIGITFFVVSIFQNSTKHYKNQNNKLWTIKLEKHKENYISITTEIKMKVVLHIFHAAFFVLWALYWHQNKNSRTFLIIVKNRIRISNSFVAFILSK